VLVVRVVLVVRLILLMGMAVRLAITTLLTSCKELVKLLLDSRHYLLSQLSIFNLFVSARVNCLLNLVHAGVAPSAHIGEVSLINLKQVKRHVRALGLPLVYV
jgi:hypothetical protein